MSLDSHRLYPPAAVRRSSNVNVVSKWRASSMSSSTRCFSNAIVTRSALLSALSPSKPHLDHAVITLWNDLNVSGTGSLAHFWVATTLSVYVYNFCHSSLDIPSSVRDRARVNSSSDVGVDGMLGQSFWEDVDLRGKMWV